MKARSIAFAIGVETHTLYRWRAGTLTPSPAGVQSLRLLVALRKVFPTLASGRIAILGDDELATELDESRLRALTAFDRDHSVRSSRATDH